MPNKDVIRLFWQESSPRIIRQWTNNTSMFCSSECEEHRVSTPIQSVSEPKHLEPTWINAHIKYLLSDTTKHSSQSLKGLKQLGELNEIENKQRSNWNQTWPTYVAKKKKNLFTTWILNETNSQKFCWYGVYIAQRKISFNTCQVLLSCSVLGCVSFGLLRS